MRKILNKKTGEEYDYLYYMRQHEICGRNEKNCISIRNRTRI